MTFLIGKIYVEEIDIHIACVSAAHLCTRNSNLSIGLKFKKMSRLSLSSNVNLLTVFRSAVSGIFCHNVFMLKNTRH